ncbi:hypothetical protein BJV77DRAFT_239913 [Russula vinacea]|nr:hypothetical protein BJV77DRAFT_239913 [Russula vinacea]
MSFLATPLAFLVFFSGLAVAQISAPNCDSTWAWSFNSLNQDPCHVTATMTATCNGGSFTIEPLQPGDMYRGPQGEDDANLCKCSTVGYSLISACAGCQGGRWVGWLEFSINCTKILPPSQFPNPVPTGTRVPHWALLDVTLENNWDFNESYIAGDTPEVLPGQVPGSSSSSSSVRGSSTATPIPTGKHSPNVGPIAGGAAGGIAAIFLIVAGLFFYRRRRRLLASAVPLSPGGGSSNAFSLMDQVPRPMSDQGTLASSLPDTTSPMKIYNPDDPTTFPAFPGTPNASYVPSQTSRIMSTTMPTPQPQRYHGLPTV